MGQALGDARQSLSRAAAWRQGHLAPPQDPAAAAALLELLDPVARLQALGLRKSAVSPPVPPSGPVTGSPTATFGRSRSHSPTPRSAAATFLGPPMSTLAHPGRVSVFDSVASATRAARPLSFHWTQLRVRFWRGASREWPPRGITTRGRTLTLPRTLPQETCRTPIPERCSPSPARSTSGRILPLRSVARWVASGRWKRDACTYYIRTRL